MQIVLILNLTKITVLVYTGAIIKYQLYAVINEIIYSVPSEMLAMILS